MRYKMKEKVWPKQGEIRYKEGYLYIPKLIGLEWRWLEYAHWSEKYWMGEDSHWHVDEWDRYEKNSPMDRLVRTYEDIMRTH